MFVASVPVFAFLAGLGAAAAGAFGGENPAETIVDATGDALPSAVASRLESEAKSLIEASSLPVLFGTFLGAMWAGSMAMGTVVKAIERIHDARSERTRIQRWVFVAGLTFAAGVLLVGALIGLLLSRVYREPLADWIGLGSPSAVVVSFLGWAVAFVLVVASATLLYRLVPPSSTDAKWVSLGGVGFGVTWLIGSAAFLIYVTTFTDEASTYGILGAILLALGWLYFSCFAFLMGKELDIVMQEQLDESG